MNFSEFAQRLYPIIGEGAGQHVFVKTILESMLEEKDREIIDSIKRSTRKAYYNGNTKITRLAQRIIAHIEPEEFVKYIHGYGDAVAESICRAFKTELPDEITQNNVGEKLAYFFEEILIEAAGTKRTPSQKPSRNNKHVSAHGTAIVTSDLSTEDKELLRAFQEESEDILRCIICNGAMTGEAKVSLCDDIEAMNEKWGFDLRKIEDQTFRNLVIAIIKTLSEYQSYLVDEFLCTTPGSSCWIRNGSIKEGEQLREEIQSKTEEARRKMRDLYKKVYAIPEDT